MKTILLGIGTLAALFLVVGLAWTQEGEAKKEDPAGEESETKEASDDPTGGASEESVRRLLDVQGSLESMKEAMIASWKQMLPAIPDSVWDGFPSDEDVKSLVNLMVVVYTEHYTQEEVDAWIAFFETPQGKGIAKKTSSFTPDLMAASQEWAMTIMPKLMAMMMQAEEGPMVVEEEEGEVAVIGALRTLSSVQAQFREGDRDGDSALDYATSLAELNQVGLIDDVLGSGTKHGYVFSLSGSTYKWKCAAKPAEGGEGENHFIVCTDGVVRFVEGKDAECSSPAINMENFMENFSRDGRKVNEENAAIGALRTISSVQAQFREGDREGDSALDYATSIAELSNVGLIDNVLGSGTKNGYVFTLSGSTYDWKCVAVPADKKSKKRKFVVCVDGVVRFSSGDTPDCTSAPIW
ncbi:MAG: DUF2059 domain-containing protein [Planctomycetota bacterium]|nr:DUF2059 domain-containing protein [Planctomycetota bacterium]